LRTGISALGSAPGFHDQGPLQQRIRTDQGFEADNQDIPRPQSTAERKENSKSIL